eukprot:561737-Pelagomonas_calceolata.AAC.5
MTGTKGVGSKKAGVHREHPCISVLACEKKTVLAFVTAIAADSGGKGERQSVSENGSSSSNTESMRKTSRSLEL